MRTQDKTSRAADGKVVGIWIRVSTEDQAKGESPEHHEKRARLYAESKEWRVAEVYHLEAVSGKSVMGQPETQRMLEDVKAGRISGDLLETGPPGPGTPGTVPVRRLLPRTQRRPDPVLCEA